MKAKAERRVVRGEALEDFFRVYETVLKIVSNRVHALVDRGVKYTPTREVAQWVAHDLPATFRKAFGHVPKPLKTWRMLTFMSNAAYLGAYESLDIRSVPGRGLTTVVKPKKLKVIKGGKS
jgi:hypothetical protein